MKALDYFRASRIQKEVGDKHEKDVATWKARHEKMAAEMQSGEFKPIALNVDYMEPEGLIFYNMSGSKMLSKDSMLYIDTITIDNGYEYTQHIMPTYFLVKNSHSKQPATVDNTTMYRVTYNKQKNSSDYSYTIETLIANADSATSKLFPEVFCAMEVTPPSVASYMASSTHEQTYSPLPKYKDADRYARSKTFAQIEDTYETKVLKKVKAFGKHPTSNFNPEREM